LFGLKSCQALIFLLAGRNPSPRSIKNRLNAEELEKRDELGRRGF
jgi:hypothetical protein